MKLAVRYFLWHSKKGTRPIEFNGLFVLNLTKKKGIAFFPKLFQRRKREIIHMKKEEHISRNLGISLKCDEQRENCSAPQTNSYSSSPSSHFEERLSVSGGFSCGSAGKESACNAGDLGSVPGLGRSPREGKGYPLQYSGLENSMDCTVHGSQRVRQDQATFTFSILLCEYTIAHSTNLLCVCVFLMCFFTIFFSYK